MSRHQVTFSILCILGSAIGLFAIIRRIVVGADGFMWAAFSLMFVCAWAAMKVLGRKPITDEAIIRVKSVPEWRELSPLRRRCMALFDWPLFLAIREREAKRLLDEPLTRVVFEAQSVTLVPIEPQHTDAYFLTMIASAAERRGLKVRNAVQGIFGPRLVGAKQIELNWLGSDNRIWNHVRNELIDGEPASLQQFNNALESGYLSTLSEAERYKYYMDNR
jgi:hypothetical protein